MDVRIRLVTNIDGHSIFNNLNFMIKINQYAKKIIVGGVARFPRVLHPP